MSGKQPPARLEVGVPFDLELGRTDAALTAPVDATFLAAGDASLVLPAFQAGDGSVRIRFAPRVPGIHRYVTRSPDPSFDGLQGTLECTAFEGDNALYRHGRLRVAPGARRLEHSDGTPFMWLGDTWWMGLTKRLRWPVEFGGLVADRVAKGFSVVQIVAGPLPDFDTTHDGIWDPQQANEGGWSWEQEWVRPDPAFYDAADKRIAALVDAGLVPCIVGMWGNYMGVMGLERVRSHWRNLVARYAAFPVVFCIAGEINYPGEGPVSDVAAQAALVASQVANWASVAREVRGLDPYRNPLTAHPAHPDVAALLGPDSALDLNMLQTSHWSYHSPPESERRDMTELLGLPRPIRLGLAEALELTDEAIARAPTMPVINAEACYEGIMGGNWQDVQRFLLWTGLLAGLAGFTYGADGIWQMSSESAPFSSRGPGWGTATWQDAMRYPGGRQVGLARRVLEGFDWWNLRGLPSDVAKRAGRVGSLAGTTDTTTVYYLPSCLVEERLRGMRGLAIDVPLVGPHTARFVDPRSAASRPLGRVEPHATGSWTPPDPPSLEDWLLIVERSGTEPAGGAPA